MLGITEVSAGPSWRSSIAPPSTRPDVSDDNSTLTRPSDLPDGVKHEICVELKSEVGVCPLLPPSKTHATIAEVK